jgi:purine nucleosidase
MTRRIIIDTDCGVDDAIAIMLALASPEVEVAGITAVSGNVALDQVMDNVLRLLSYLDRPGIPVFRGASQPLVEKWHRAESVHGANGLGDVELPPPAAREQDARAPEGILRIARENPGLTILALGPLTNLAIAVNLYPELTGLIGGIVSMGGGIERGNITRYAEFNYFADPESVQFVLDSGIPLSVLTWDATLTVAYGREELEALGFPATASGRLFLELQRVPLAWRERMFGMKVNHLPDPLAAGYLLDPSIARKRIRGNLRMELAPGSLRGASVTVEGQKVDIVLEIDKPSFTRLLSRIIALKR